MGARELNEPTPGDKRFQKRNDDGTWGAADDVGKSLAADQRRHSDHDVKPGHGDEGDRRKS